MSKHGIFIGRFQPIHEGHVTSLVAAASQVERLYIFIGSANLCRSIKNPWLYVERASMVIKKLKKYCDNFSCVPLNDYRYNDARWISDITRTTNQLNIEQEATLFGHFKDGNDYLKWFPQWNYVNIDAEHDICATDVRNQLFTDRSDLLPPNVINDWDYFCHERQLYASYPYPESLTLNCGDAVVECRDRVLLIKRKRAPGADTWALPGGHKNANETFVDCAIRELFEETGIAISTDVVRDCIVNTRLFDDPYRSHGVPRNTLAVYIILHTTTLPVVNAADDAAECRWVPIQEAVDNYLLYDDHSAIISEMTKVYPHVAVNNVPMLIL